MKTTKNRQEILAILEGSLKALSVSEIQSSLPHINLTTVYRNLEAFVKNKQVKKLSFADEARFEIQETPHHHAICDKCNEVIHFTTNDKKLIREFDLPNFTITDIEITIRGHCQKPHKEALQKKQGAKTKKENQSK